MLLLAPQRQFQIPVGIQRRHFLDQIIPPDGIVQRNAATFANRQQQGRCLRRQPEPVQGLCPLAAETQAQIATLQSGGNLHSAVGPLPACLRRCALQFSHGLPSQCLVNLVFSRDDLQRGRIDIETRFALLQEQGLSGKTGKQGEADGKAKQVH